MVIYESEREIEVLDEVDVLVAGAGVAGCAAAAAATRAGAKTMLVERNGVLGGVATAGLMADIGNRYMDRDGRLVVRGIAKEVIDRMVARGAASEKWASREVAGIVLDSEQLKVVLIEMQQEAEVKVLTHTLAARSIMDDDTVKGVFIESKMGRQAVLAKVVVDTTGEADIGNQAGCPMRWETGTASLEFKMGRVNLDALYQHFKRYPETFPVGMDMVKGFSQFERNWVERGIFFFPHGGGTKWDIFQKAIKKGEFQPTRGILWRLDAAGMYGLKHLDTVIINSNFWRVKSLNAPDVSLAELETQKVCYYVADFFHRHVPGFEKAYIVQMATDLGIRVSRGIEGETTLTPKDVSSNQPVYFNDTIGCSPARVRSGGGSDKKTGDFFYAHSFDIPYRIMVPKKVENLLVASGKSVSCQPQGLLRDIIACMVLGQSAGAGAALAAKEGITPRALNIRSLQRILLEQEVNLGSDDRLKGLGLR